MTVDQPTPPSSAAVPGSHSDGQPDHELEVLEADETVPPRAEELVADAANERTSEPAPKQT